MPRDKKLHYQQKTVMQQSLKWEGSYFLVSHSRHNIYKTSRVSQKRNSSSCAAYLSVRSECVRAEQRRLRAGVLGKVDAPSRTSREGKGVNGPVHWDFGDLWRKNVEILWLSRKWKHSADQIVGGEVHLIIPPDSQKRRNQNRMSGDVKSLQIKLWSPELLTHSPELPN